MFRPGEAGHLMSAQGIDDGGQRRCSTAKRSDMNFAYLVAG